MCFKLTTDVNSIHYCTYNWNFQRLLSLPPYIHWKYQNIINAVHVCCTLYLNLSLLYVPTHVDVWITAAYSPYIFLALHISNYVFYIILYMMWWFIEVLRYMAYFFKTITWCNHFDIRIDFFYIYTSICLLWVNKLWFAINLWFLCNDQGLLL